MKRTAVVASGYAVWASLVFVSMGQGCKGCQKDEAPPPLPSSTEPAASPPPVVNLAPPLEDAGQLDDAGDADAAVKGKGKPSDVSGLRACCAALQSNAASMPPPNNVYAANAAAYCTATLASVNTSGQKDAFLAAIRGALRGASIPAQCK